MKVVQIGSNKGNDDLSKYLKSNFEKLDFGLFVEPNVLCIEDLKKCYSNYDNIFIENVAIKTPFQDEDELEIFYNTYDYSMEISSCKLSHIETHTYWCPEIKNGEIKSFKIPSLTLENLFEKYNIIDLDWLLLDVEGIDAEIILTFNWEKYKIKRIEFEHLHLGNFKYNIKCMMNGMGYKKINSLYEFDWAFEKI
jgi:FkbM family methyltransferase